MGGYASKLKGKIKSKWKAKFGSGSKPVEQSALSRKTDVSRSNEQILKELQSRQGNAAEPTSENEEFNRGSITGAKVIKGDSFLNSFKEDHIPQFENDETSDDAGNGWKRAKPTINQDIGKKMAADADFTKEQLQEVENEETKRFNAAHLDEFLREHIGVEAYQKYSTNYYYTIMNNLARNLELPKMIKVKRDLVLPVTEEAVKDAKKALQAMSEDMKEGLFSQLEEDRTVYRGVGSDYIGYLRKQFGIGDEVTGEELNRKLKGNVYFDRAFTSTSLNPNVAGSFAKNNIKKDGKKEATIIQIRAPKGLRAKYIAPISAYKTEDELLVDQNTPLRILDVKMTVDPKTKITYRLVRAEFLSSFIGEHRARMSNDYGLQEEKSNHLKKQGPIPQVNRRLSSGEGSGPGTLIKVAERKVK